MADITPFKVSIPQESLDRLHQKLALADFPDELDEAEWDYGAPLADIKRLTKHWLEKYDWRAEERKINELPQFKTSVTIDRFGDLDLHFVHQKSPIKNAIPLIFVHGWPGSFLEVTKILPLLSGSSDGSPAFHVIAPSIPNFGFSQGVKTKGFAVPQYAEACHKLMLKLGYNEYVTQGGDWGWWITRTIGRLYPTHCLASHYNMLSTVPPSPTTNPLLSLQHALTPYTAAERAGLARTAWFRAEGQGYGAIQNTKPQTLGYSLASSPVGLLAWIYEKLHDWTDSYPWTDDEVLTWVSVYYFSTAGPAASVRIYYENTHDAQDARTGLPAWKLAQRWTPGVKIGVGHFPRDIYVLPPLWSRALGEVVYEGRHERGGHFAAYEVPELIVGDLRAMFGKRGGAFGVVKGKDGVVG
ncbi:alpha/beta-hydrolase [Mytilinidion resinicola]|uniref:Alpha/beta-hydrolase n=1 Tax=Mytilinidion resinicola TaxID=574789 RepID=A0A6A6YUM2_9PEZI|nr:alpha/beta-hydrolase [Mytilinidion resinicola]KAF2812656.1 alpha/beta-hydrolase [Mytilinidion resinicola]